MAAIRTDTFTNSDGTALGTHNALWVAVQGAYIITSNAARSNSSGTETSVRDNETYNNNQYSQGTCSAVANGGWIGVSVRNSSSIVSYYEVYSDSANDCSLAVMENGTWTALGTTTPVTAGDVLYLEANGTSILAKKNGSNLFGGAVTNAGIASGQAGVAGYSNLAGSLLDNWEGGDLGGAASNAPIRRNRSFSGLIVR